MLALGVRWKVGKCRFLNTTIGRIDDDRFTLTESRESLASLGCFSNDENSK